MSILHLGYVKRLAPHNVLHRHRQFLDEVYNPNCVLKNLNVISAVCIAVLWFGLDGMLLGFLFLTCTLFLYRASVSGLDKKQCLPTQSSVRYVQIHFNKSDGVRVFCEDKEFIVYVFWWLAFILFIVCKRFKPLVPLRKKTIE